MKLNGTRFPFSLFTATAVNALLAFTVFFICIMLQGFWSAGRELLDKAISDSLLGTLASLADAESMVPPLASQRTATPGIGRPLRVTGSGGVDFPSLKKHLDNIAWQGWLTTELDTSPQRPPKESAAISLRYLKETLKIDG